MFPQKATTNELIKTYAELKSVWKVAEKFSMCGQSVHERLKKAGIILKGQKYTQKECELIKEVYKNDFKAGNSELNELSERLGRSVTSIVTKARKIGLTNNSRKLSQSLCEKNSERMRKWHSENDHPRGMKGKCHTEEFKKKCGKRLSNWWANASEEEKYQNRRKALTTKRANGNDNNHRGSWKAAWRTIGGKKKFFRSRWEANYARYLEYLKIEKFIKDWFHEPETFWFEKIRRGVRSYLPDFKITNNDETHYWVEVKGYMDDKSKTKLKRFAKYFPKEKLQLIDKKWFTKNSDKMRIICPDWE